MCLLAGFQQKYELHKLSGGVLRVGLQHEDVMDMLGIRGSLKLRGFHYWQKNANSRFRDDIASERWFFVVDRLPRESNLELTVL